MQTEVLKKESYGAGLNARVNDVKKIGLKTAFIICSVIAVIGIWASMPLAEFLTFIIIIIF